MAQTFAGILVFLLVISRVAVADVIDVETRDSSIRILIEGPEAPTHVVAIFAGGNGNTGIENDGSIGRGRGNFAVRSREFFHDHSMSTVVVTSPNDHRKLRYHRDSDNYAVDLENVMAELRKRFPSVPIWMHGTSRGSISITLTITKFKDPANKPDGIVLSSSVTEPNDKGNNVHDGKLEAITGAALVVAHKDDPCHITPASSAPELLSSLKKASPKKLMILEGGGNGRGRDCGAFTQHGFVNMEREAIDAMAGWIKNPN